MQDAFAEVVILVAIAELDGFVFAGGGSAGNGGAAFGSAVKDDVGLDGGIAAGVKDFACMDRDDLGHVAPVFCDAECWETTRWFKRSFNFGRRSTGTVRPPAREMDCTRCVSDGVT